MQNLSFSVGQIEDKEAEEERENKKKKLNYWRLNIKINTMKY